MNSGNTVAQSPEARQIRIDAPVLRCDQCQVMLNETMPLDRRTADLNAILKCPNCGHSFSLLDLTRALLISIRTLTDALLMFDPVAAAEFAEEEL